MQMTVAEMIKQTRTESNMTQEEFGQKFGITRQSVSAWENGRSMPDLQTLIDICNTYHISLDKLLNEDKEYITKIDFSYHLKKIIKRIAPCIIIFLLLFTGIFVRWKIISINKNTEFAEAAAQMGFVLENGVYRLKEDDVLYQLPNQKLPFLKEDFYVKNSYADFEIDTVETQIILYNDNNVSIYFNHNRFIRGNISENGELIPVDNTLNTKEQQLFDENSNEIERILKQLFVIHNSVYSV